nr:MFS transporter [Micromonospora sp. DSM 115978]
MVVDRWWVPTGVATAGMASSALPMYAVAALAPFLVTDLGLSRVGVGALITVSFVVAAAMSLVAGHLVDALGAKVGLAGLCATMGLGLVAASLAGAYGWLVVALAMTGVAQALANPATNVLVARRVPVHRRGMAIGIKQSGVQVASFASGLVLPALAVAAGWRVALRWTAVLPAVLLLVVWWLVPGREPGGRAGWSRWSAPRGWLAWLVGFSLLLGTGLSSVNTYLPLYATQRLGLGAAVGGAVLAAFGVTGFLARVGWGRFSDRLPEVTVALAWLSLAAVCGVLLVLLAAVWGSGLVWVGAVVVGGSATAANAVSMLAVVRRGGATGHASALVSLGFFAGFVMGPSTFGAVADLAGYGWSWALVSAVFAGSALVGMGARRAATQPVAGPSGRT